MAKSKTKLTAVNETETKQAAIKQTINNTLAYVGDEYFKIRQAESAITGFYAKIDQLREELGKLAGVGNGPQTPQ